MHQSSEQRRWVRRHPQFIYELKANKNRNMFTERDIDSCKNTPMSKDFKTLRGIGSEPGQSTTAHFSLASERRSQARFGLPGSITIRREATRHSIPTHTNDDEDGDEIKQVDRVSMNKISRSWRRHVEHKQLDPANRSSTYLRHATLVHGDCTNSPKRSARRRCRSSRLCS